MPSTICERGSDVSAWSTVHLANFLGIELGEPLNVVISACPTRPSRPDTDPTSDKHSSSGNELDGILHRRLEDLS